MVAPAEVLVGSATYAVQLKKKLPEGRYGDTRNGLTSIRLNEGLSLSAMQDTLLHESLHAIVHMSGMQHSLGFDDAEEERMIRVLTPWLVSLIRDNPSLIAYLREG